MKPKDIVKKLVPSADEIELQLEQALLEAGDEGLPSRYEESVKNFSEDSILKGHVVNIVGDDIIVDVGYKSEGTIGLNEFPDPGSVKIGDSVEVYLEAVEDDAGFIVLSKKRADRIRGWEK